MPKRHLSHGFEFPSIPGLMRKLTSLEERLVSPRIPFMQIRSLGVYQQKGLRGNVVNIENDLDACARPLPRRFNETATLQVMLMRKMKYKAPYIFETDRPKIVAEAAKYLCDTELYKVEGIRFSENWLQDHPEETNDFIVDRESVEVDMFEEIQSAEQRQIPDSSSDEDEEEAKRNPGADETYYIFICFLNG